MQKYKLVVMLLQQQLITSMKRVLLSLPLQPLRQFKKIIFTKSA